MDNVINKNHPLYNKKLTFKGKLSYLTEDTAADLCKIINTEYNKVFYKNTELLILGMTSYKRYMENKHSNMLDKARSLEKIGSLKIMSEIDFAYLFDITFSPVHILKQERNPNKSDKYPNKGNSLIEFPNEYIVLDLETTGYIPESDNIIEIAMIKISNNKIIDSYSSLINPGHKINEYIQTLTGITNQMLKDAPRIEDVLPQALNFLENSIIVGYNVNFDINFLYTTMMNLYEKPLENDFVDVMRLAKKCLNSLPNKKLATVCKHFNIDDNGHHRAKQDCVLTFQCYQNIKSLILKEYGSIEEFKNSYYKKSKYKVYNKLNAKDITTENTDFNENSPLYQKSFVFTGTLTKMTRKEAMQIVVDLGGFCENNITKKSNFLVIGDYDYNSAIKNGKSSKQIKAEKLILKGQDLKIIPENVFYTMVNNK